MQSKFTPGLAREDEAARAELVRQAQKKRLDAWTAFGADFGKSAVGARWVLTRAKVVGVKTAPALLVAKAFQDPDLEDSIADTSG